MIKQMQIIGLFQKKCIQQVFLKHNIEYLFSKQSQKNKKINSKISVDIKNAQVKQVKQKTAKKSRGKIKKTKPAHKQYDKKQLNDQKDSNKQKTLKNFLLRLKSKAQINHVQQQDNSYVNQSIQFQTKLLKFKQRLANFDQQNNSSTIQTNSIRQVRKNSISQKEKRKRKEKEIQPIPNKIQSPSINNFKSKKIISFYERLMTYDKKQTFQMQNIKTKQQQIANKQQQLKARNIQLIIQQDYLKIQKQTFKKQRLINQKQGLINQKQSLRLRFKNQKKIDRKQTPLFQQSQKNKQIIKKRNNNSILRNKQVYHRKKQVYVQRLVDLQQKDDQSNKVFTKNEHNFNIQTLQNVISKVSNDIKPPNIQEFNQNLFYVLDSQNKKQLLVPFGFRYYILRFCKYLIYFQHNISPEEYLLNLSKLIQTIKYYCLSETSISQTKQMKDNKMKYMEHFLQNLLPNENKEFLKDTFLQVGIKYFTLKKQFMKQNKNSQSQISVNLLCMIQLNLHRLLFSQQNHLQDDEGEQEDYLLHRTFLNLYLDFYCQKKQQIQTSDMVECVQMAKFLKVTHPQFIQYIKQSIQTKKQNYSTIEFLLMLAYLVQSKCTPYEYFYRNKGKWIDIIEQTHDFSSKKTVCCIKLLQIFSREKFIHCQQIYFKILQNIQKNFEAMDGKQLVRTLFYYSRARYGINPVFIANIVNKIYVWLPYLQERQFSLLVRSIGNLNYQSGELVQKLKNINYQKFLIQLKYGCNKLGSYYKQILKQVQSQSRGKQYFEGEPVNIDNQAPSNCSLLQQVV